jgi:hypothetical protein
LSLHKGFYAIAINHQSVAGGRQLGQPIGDRGPTSAAENDRCFDIFQRVRRLAGSALDDPK